VSPSIPLNGSGETGKSPPSPWGRTPHPSAQEPRRGRTAVKASARGARLGSVANRSSEIPRAVRRNDLRFSLWRVSLGISEASISRRNRRVARHLALASMRAGRPATSGGSVGQSFAVRLDMVQVVDVQVVQLPHRDAPGSRSTVARSCWLPTDAGESHSLEGHAAVCTAILSSRSRAPRRPLQSAIDCRVRTRVWQIATAVAVSMASR
jgi:hypothetical protein